MFNWFRKPKKVTKAAEYAAMAAQARDLADNPPCLERHGSTMAYVQASGKLYVRSNYLEPKEALALAAWIKETFE